MLLLSSLGVQMLLGELFSLGGSGGGESISETKDGGSDDGVAAGCWSDGGSEAAASSVRSGGGTCFYKHEGGGHLVLRSQPTRLTPQIFLKLSS